MITPNRKIRRRAMVRVRAACLLAAACIAAMGIPPAAAAETPSGSIVGVAGPLDLPVPNKDFIAVALGTNMLGLKPDGSIVAVGANESGESDVPSPNTGFIAVAAGAYSVCLAPWTLCSYVGFCLGLKADGSVVGWGDNTYGQLDVPEPNADFIAIAAGHGQSLGLKADGSIVGWGATAEVPQPNTGFVAVAAGLGYNLGLKADGSIVEWGNDGSGPYTLAPPNSGFIAIAAGGYSDWGAFNSYSLGLKADGSLVTWGCCPEQVDCTTACCEDFGVCDVPEPNTGFVAISAGPDYALGLKADGSTVSWGHYTEVPQPNSNIIAIAAGRGSGVGIRQNGACCDLLAGTCEDDVDQDECSGAQQLWTKGGSCVDVVCDATPGACCNHHAAPLAIEGTCEETTINECTCDGCDWTKGATCAEITCDADFVDIPTVSEWGLMVLTLLLLTAGKLAFRRPRHNNMQNAA